MANKKFVVELSGEERKRLRDMIAKGKSNAATILKVRILLKTDQGEGGEGGPMKKSAAHLTPTSRWWLEYVRSW